MPSRTLPLVIPCADEVIPFGEALRLALPATYVSNHRAAARGEVEERVVRRVERTPIPDERCGCNRDIVGCRGWLRFLADSAVT